MLSSPTPNKCPFSRVVSNLNQFKLVHRTGPETYQTLTSINLHLHILSQLHVWLIVSDSYNLHVFGPGEEILADTRRTYKLHAKLNLSFEVKSPKSLFWVGFNIADFCEFYLGR